MRLNISFLLAKPTNVWLSALGQTFHGDFSTAQSLDLPFSFAAQPNGLEVRPLGELAEVTYIPVH